MRVLFFLFATITVLLHWNNCQRSIKLMLSTGIYFSNQIVGFMTLWMIFLPTNYGWISDMLALYGIMIFVIFYGAIIPINGFPSDPLVMIVDFLIHFCLPLLFFIYRYKYKKNAYSALFSRIVLYPNIYWIFITFASKRRGYTIYPFLNDGIMLSAIVIGLYLGHKLFCYEKQFDKWIKN